MTGGAISDHPRAVSAENTYVPLALTALMCAATAAAVVYYFQDRSSIDEQIREQGLEINRRVDTVATTVDKLASSIDTLSKSMVNRTEDRFYRQDMVNTCLRLMILNKGFKCPSDLMGPNRPDTWQTQIVNP